MPPMIESAKPIMPRAGWRWLIFAAALVIAALAGCRPQAARAVPLPSPQPALASAADLESAEQVARRYLEAWRAQNFEGMHRLLTFHNQESIPLESFRAAYENAQSAMTLEDMAYKAQTLFRDGRVLVFQYQMTFHTRILGSFVDDARRLRLVADPEVGQWRIAWSLGDIFAEMGDGARLVFEPQIPSRANIYDRHGSALADQNGRVVRVFVHNADIPDRPACFRILAQTVNQSLDEIVELFDIRSLRHWEVDAGIMEPPVFTEYHQQVEELCNAEFRQQSTRRYLRGALMPHIIGHVGYPDEAQIPELEALGYNAETIIGQSGVEASWNDVLSGRPGGRLTLVSAAGARLRVLTEVRSRIPESIWLTIDAALQENIARLLDEAYRVNRGSWGRTSKGAAVVVMDVHNGDILAMVSYPSFEGNVQNPFPAVGREVADAVLGDLAQDERSPQLNRPAQGAYPVGSIMKGISAIAALESGVYDNATRYFCSGSWTNGYDVLYDWLAAGHGSMTVQTALTNSCNPFFYEAGFRLDGQDRYLLPSYAIKLGLGAPTGIAAIDENSGHIPTPDNVLQTTGDPWSYAFAINLAIGQGEMQATPLQMARMYAAVANGGALLRPQLVREHGLLDQRAAAAKRDVMLNTEIAADHLAIIQRGLCDVVGSPVGTAARPFSGSSLLDIGVCGKTGTAQVPGENVRPHSWFVAYAPAQDPQIVVITLIENGGEGSLVAAPITRSILETYFFGAP